MCKLAPALLLFSLVLSGCGKGPEAKVPVATQATIVKTTSVSGFDADAEPQIHHMSDGSLQIMLEFMPPSFIADEDAEGVKSFDDFDKQLERAIGVPVHWEDSELFIIRKPKNDTAERVKQFLEGYPKAQKP